MSVVGKSTCSGFKTGLYISYYGSNAVKYIKQRGYFMKDCQISGYLDTKYVTVLRIELILHNFEDSKIANFLTWNRSIFAWHSPHGSDHVDWSTPRDRQLTPAPVIHTVNISIFTGTSVGCPEVCTDSSFWITWGVLNTFINI